MARRPAADFDSRICQKCGADFVLRPGKPGLINQCPDCATDIAKVGGNMIWSHKTAPELEIKSMVEAKIFARATNRFGAGPLRAITQSKEQAHKSLIGESPFDPGDGAAKTGSGAENRAQYFSRLGEKRIVKQ